MTTAAETLAPSCFEQLSNFNMELGQMTTFDQNHGMALLTEGSECWNEVREGFQAAANFVETQLAMATNDGLGEVSGAVAEDITTSLTEATEEATGITAYIKEINKYTDQQMLISMYSWDPEDVIDGESVGICHQPSGDADNYATCWEWSMVADEGFGSSPTSYLINTNLITDSSSLNSQPKISAVNIPAMFGNWICSPPMELAMRMRTTCARLLPREQTIEDPKFSVDQEVTVMTYYSSRLSGRTQAPKDVNGNVAFRSVNTAFEAFRINMEESMGISMFDGAMTTYTSTAIGLVAAISAFAF